MADVEFIGVRRIARLALDAAIVLSDLEVIDAAHRSLDFPVGSMAFVCATMDIDNKGRPGSRFLSEICWHTYFLVDPLALKAAMGSDFAEFARGDLKPYTDDVLISEMHMCFLSFELALPLVSSPGSGSAASPLRCDPGSGRCSAFALARLGVHSAEEAAFALDRRMRWFPHGAGVFSDSWPLDVIKHVVIDAGWHFKKLVIEPTRTDRVDLRDTLRHGAFFMYGHVNRQFYRGKQLMVTSEDTSTDPRECEHSCAVIDNRFYEWNTDAGKFMGMSCDWLWLDDMNKPSSKGYFRDICSVYRVYRCSATDGCKGECFDPLTRPMPKPRKERARVGHRRSERGRAGPCGA